MKTATIKVAIGSGPGQDETATGKPDAGFTGLHPWRYVLKGGEGDSGAALLMAIDREIVPGLELRYAVHPAFDPLTADVRNAFGSTAIALDILFDDQTRLSALTPHDQHGVIVTAQSQFEAKILFVNQWNLKRVPLDAAVGRRAIAIEASAWIPPRVGKEHAGQANGWLDAVEIAPAAPVPTRPSDWVRTTRGTNSNDVVSRGNAIPAVALPHGFVFGTPVTNASDARWPYSWQGDNGADNRPRIQAFATSHIASPWIGERGAFQIMPSTLREPRGDPARRSLGFDHDAESDGPHRYAVELDGGISAELTAGFSSIHLRFAFAPSAGNDVSIIFDQLGYAGGLTLPAPGGRIFTGFVDGPDPTRPDIPRMFVYGTIDHPVSASRMLGAPGKENVRGFTRFELGDEEEERVITVRVGTSFIGTEQARHNLDADVSAAPQFDDVATQAQEAWDSVLGVITVEGASPDQRATLYSNLYRLHLYPNESAENTGTAEKPEWSYASPFRSLEGHHSPEHTGCVVLPGHLTVNNGFWDTYRTCWPALTLFAPTLAGRLLDGLVQHYLDGGWTSRWTAPGPVDCMTGTTTDLIFADAMTKGIAGFDTVDAYQSAIRNATVPSTDPRVGRKGIEHAIFRGYVATDVVEGMSWTLDAAINDFGLAVSSRLFQEDAADTRLAEEYRANAVYFASRALRYTEVFDERIGFFQGRTPSGAWRLPVEEYDPRIWGFDYTETNGWGTAFTVPHDGEGLAALYGGRPALERKLDAFFAKPEAGSLAVRGSYSYQIHEITEARDLRMGMLALSNQPAHHIPFMYLFAGVPHKTQAIVRECLARMFVGSEIGQGYPGDEDNGEMSTWHTFASLGFYPLTPASGRYALTSPLYKLARIRLENGAEIVIDAPGNSRENVYIQSVAVNGERWDDVTIPHALLAAGARIEFELGPTPSSWGSGSVPPSLTPPGGGAPPLFDLMHPADAAERLSSNRAEPHFAIDDCSTSGPVRLAAGDWVAWRLPSAQDIPLYTLTPDTAGQRSWLLEGSGDGKAWETVDERRHERFAWDRQTRPFLPQHPSHHRHYRITALDPLELAQWELLGPATRSRPA